MGLLLGVLLAPTAQAQLLRGTVLEADTVQGAAGAILEVSVGGEPLRRVLVGRSGVFVLPVPAGRQVQLRGLRIGRQPTQGPGFTMPSRDTTVRLVLTGAPVQLDRVTVVEGARCGPPDEGGAQVATLWEEARKALLAATLDAEREAAVVTWSRALRRDSLVVTHDEAWTRTRQPRVARAISADSLERLGYLFPEAEVLHVFGPDPELLLGERFAATHCFGVHRTRPADRRVGLDFRPAGRPRAPDIRGTLWLDASSGRLEHLEFTYTDRPAGVPRGAAGGELRFASTPDGAWFVSTWRLWVPVSAEGASEALHHVTGGDVGTMVSMGDTVYRGALARVEGLVVDEGGGAAPGARVFLQGTSIAVRADSTGRFVMPRVVPGRYAIGAASRTLDSLGVARADQQVWARADSVHALRLVIPRAARVVATVCDRGDGGLLRGVVDAADGRPAGDTRVTIEWLEPTRTGFERRRETRLTTDERGTFRLCGAPAGWRFRVWAGEPAARSDVVVATIPASTMFAVVRLRLP